MEIKDISLQFPYKILCKSGIRGLGWRINARGNAGVIVPYFSFAAHAQ